MALQGLQGTELKRRVGEEGAALKRQPRTGVETGLCLSYKKDSNSFTVLPPCSGNLPWAQKGCGALVSRRRVAGAGAGEESRACACGVEE